MKVIFILLTGVFLSSGAFAKSTTLFSCDENKITMNSENYLLGSDILIDSSKGSTSVVEDNENRYVLVNREEVYVADANVFVTLTTLLTIDKLTGEGQIIKVDDEGEAGTTYLSSCK